MYTLPVFTKRMKGKVMRIRFLGTAIAATGLWYLLSSSSWPNLTGLQDVSMEPVRDKFQTWAAGFAEKHNAGEGEMGRALGGQWYYMDDKTPRPGKAATPPGYSSHSDHQ